MSFFKITILLIAVTLFSPLVIHAQTLFDPSFFSAFNSLPNVPAADVGSGAPYYGITYQGNPFGGLIQDVEYCFCSANFLLTINDLVTNSQKKILADPVQSKLYLFQQNFFSKGHWVLGTYTPGPMCIQIGSNGCYPKQTDGMINRGPGAGADGPQDPSLDWPSPYGQ